MLMFVNFRGVSINAKIQLEQSLTDYIGETQLILSEVTDIGDTSFNEASLIPNLIYLLRTGLLQIFSFDSTRKKKLG